MKLGGSPSLVQSDTGQLLHPSRAGAVRLGRRVSNPAYVVFRIFLSWSHPALSAAVLSARVQRTLLGGVGGRGGGGGGGGAVRRPNFFLMWRGGAGGDGLQGLLPGRVLQRFVEQIIDKDGLTVLKTVEVPQLQFIVVGLGMQRIETVQKL